MSDLCTVFKSVLALVRSSPSLDLKDDTYLTKLATFFGQNLKRGRLFWRSSGAEQFCKLTLLNPEFILNPEKRKSEDLALAILAQAPEEIHSYLEQWVQHPPQDREAFLASEAVLNVVYLGVKGFPSMEVLLKEFVHPAWKSDLEGRSFFWTKELRMMTIEFGKKIVQEAEGESTAMKLFDLLAPKLRGGSAQTATLVESILQSILEHSYEVVPPGPMLNMLKKFALAVEPLLIERNSQNLLVPVYLLLGNTEKLEISAERWINPPLGASPDCLTWVRKLDLAKPAIGGVMLGELHGRIDEELRNSTSQFAPCFPTAELFLRQCCAPFPNTINRQRYLAITFTILKHVNEEVLNEGDMPWNPEPALKFFQLLAEKASIMATPDPNGKEIEQEFKYKIREAFAKCEHIAYKLNGYPPLRRPFTDALITLLTHHTEFDSASRIPGVFWMLPGSVVNLRFQHLFDRIDVWFQSSDSEEQAEEFAESNSSYFMKLCAAYLVNNDQPLPTHHMNAIKIVCSRMQKVNDPEKFRLLTLIYNQTKVQNLAPSDFSPDFNAMLDIYRTQEFPSLSLDVRVTFFGFASEHMSGTLGWDSADGVEALKVFKKVFMREDDPSVLKCILSIFLRFLKETKDDNSVVDVKQLHTAHDGELCAVFEQVFQSEDTDLRIMMLDNLKDLKQSPCPDCAFSTHWAQYDFLAYEAKERELQDDRIERMDGLRSVCEDILQSQAGVGQQDLIDCVD